MSAPTDYDLRSVTVDIDPERIAHFRILGRIGQGGMGIVYRAEDERLRRTVALKVLPDAFARDEERRRRFLREARAAAAITHPNIATIHEVDEDRGRVFLAMELVEGEVLRDKIARGRVAVIEAVRLARGIARGLARAHAKGIVHRDLKPDNVIIDADGEPKILDFGLAKLREHEASDTALEGAETASAATEQGRALGTPQYMSPEQARGGEIDGRSDLFSFGVLLYEMLSGERPFAGGSSAELMAAILRDTPVPLGKRAPDVPAQLASIVDRCMAKSPADRWQGARELVEAIEAVATSGSVKSELGVSVAARRFGRQRVWLVAVLLLPVAAVATILGLTRSRTLATPPPVASGGATPPSSS